MDRNKSTSYAKPFLDEAFVPKGRPSNYPIPEVENLLFFVQRNYNFDTICYQINMGNEGLINVNNPINVFWIKYNKENIERQELNYMQRKLAYGYNFNIINNETFEFEFVSYPKKFYLVYENEKFQVKTKLNGNMVNFTNAYIYAEESGVFPDVKFFELFGVDNQLNENVYEKIIIND